MDTLVICVMLQVLSCGGEYDAPAGHIDFPVGEGVQYGHSLACDYTIRGEQGKVRSRIRINLCFLNLIACPQTSLGQVIKSVKAVVG